MQKTIQNIAVFHHFVILVQLCWIPSEQPWVSVCLYISSLSSVVFHQKVNCMWETFTLQNVPQRKVLLLWTTWWSTHTTCCSTSLIAFKAANFCAKIQFLYFHLKHVNFTWKVKATTYVVSGIFLQLILKDLFTNTVLKVSGKWFWFPLLLLFLCAADIFL